MKKFLVTGGGGFIGSNLSEHLVRQGHHVRILDNFLTGNRENLSSFLNQVELVEGDIRDLKICRKAAAGMDFVFHQAALPSVPRSIEDPLLTNEINVTGTLNMLIASNESKVKRFVFASSSSVYGDNPDLPKKEGKEGIPLSPYAVTKLVGEKYLQVFSEIYGLETVSLRYFNIFGPRQDPHSQYAAVIPNFITGLLDGNTPRIFGDGEQSRDFTFVANVVRANMLAVEAENISGNAFNIACGDRITVNTLYKKIAYFVQKDTDPIYDKPRPGDILHSFADIEKAQRMMQYEPSVSFEEGLKDTVRWYKNKE